MLFQCNSCKNSDGTERTFEVSEDYAESRSEDYDVANKKISFCPHCGAPRSQCEEV